VSDYVASVPYSQPPVDFAAALDDAPGVRISRPGRQRRVHLKMDPAMLQEVRSRLPGYILLEEAAEFGYAGAARR